MCLFTQNHNSMLFDKTSCNEIISSKEKTNHFLDGVPQRSSLHILRDQVQSFVFVEDADKL